VSERGEWGAWLEYVLNGMARQAEDALSRAQRINHHLSQWRRDVAGLSSKTPTLLLDALAGNPFLTVRKAANQLRVAFTTVQRAMEKLERRGIVTEVSEAKRHRVYCAKALLDILEEPARLTPAGTA